VKGKDSDFDLILEPGRSEKNYWMDLWRYRELFYILSWRDVKVRYKQTVIGFAWSVLRPVLTMVIFVIVFGKIAKLPSDGVPYPILVFSALLPWQFFAIALTESGNSLISNSSLVSKIYFPRIIIPTSSVIVSLVDLMISLILLLILILFYWYPISWQILLIPVFILVAFCAAFGSGLLISALNVKYRDFRYIIPFIVQLGLFISPVGFSSSIVPEKWKVIYSLNPMVGVIDGFRWAILGGDHPFPVVSLSLALLVILALFLIGLRFFRRTEKKFADVI